MPVFYMVRHIPLFLFFRFLNPFIPIFNRLHFMMHTFAEDSGTEVRHSGIRRILSVKEYIF